MRLVKSVESFDQKVGLEYLVLPTVFLSGEFGTTQSRASPLVLGQCMVRNFRRRRDGGLESRLFHFEFVDPLFQSGYRMFGFFHRSIFSIDGQPT